jgi:hypothetical protein
VALKPEQAMAKPKLRRAKRVTAPPLNRGNSPE